MSNQLTSLSKASLISITTSHLKLFVFYFLINWLRLVYFILCVWLFDLQVSLCTMCVLCLGGQKKASNPWSWSSRWLWATLWGLGTTPGFSARTADALNLWVISPTPVFHFLIWLATSSGSPSLAHLVSRLQIFSVMAGFPLQCVVIPAAPCVFFILIFDHSK